MSDPGSTGDGAHGRMTLRRRLALLLGISTAVLVVAGLILFSSLSTLSTERARVVQGLDPAVLAARDLRTAMVDQETGVRGFVLNPADAFLEPHDRGVRAEQDAVAVLEPLVADDADLMADLRAAREASAAWQAQFADPAIDQAKRGDAQGAREDDFQADGRELFEEVRDNIDRLETDLNGRRDAAVLKLDAAASRVWTVAVCAIIGLLALGIVIVVALKRSVTDPIIELAGEVRAIAEGDLDHTVSVEGTPELERLAADIDAMRLQILGEIARLSEANAAIEQQSLELQRSNDDLEQFAYVASHDLQEPLRKIAGFCQLLERRYKGQLDDRADEYIAFVVDGAQRMQDLINDLLAFSRVGRTTARFAPVDLGEAADEAVTNLRSAIDESGARIDVASLPTVAGDRRLLVALFQNLIGNGVKFHGADPPVVRVTAERAVGTGDVSDDGAGAGDERAPWVISVADNGIGINAEYAEQIFTIFQRLHNRTDYDGTGIGLALAKKIAEHHGGSIWLDTDVAVGATFHVTLPVLDLEPPTTGVPEGGEPAARLDTSALEGATLHPPADGTSPVRGSDVAASSPRTAQEANP